MKIVLLGCSGWISHYVAHAIMKRASLASIIGTYKTRRPASNFPMISLSNADHDHMLDLLEREEPTAIVNMTRGESDADFIAHQKIIDFSNVSGSHYFYTSSFNACDAQLTHDHLETELPSAASEYGKFKANCERALLETSKKFAIFRFSATHGWAPNRCARTEEFLKKVVAGEDVIIPTGIIQNRTAVNDLAEMIAALVIAGGEGIFNLGSSDASDEVDFLRRLAIAFGYDGNAVVSGEQSPTNANMVPDKIYKMFGNEFYRTEEHAIANVARMPELNRYKRRDSSLTSLAAHSAPSN